MVGARRARRQRRSRSRASSPRRQLEVAGKKLTPPLDVRRPARTPLSVGGKAYRGRVLVSSTGGKLEVVNALQARAVREGRRRLEMPDRWPAAALEAQAVAARTYALARMRRRRQGAHLRHLRRHAQPGLRRHRGRDAGGRRGRRRDGPAASSSRRQGDHGLLLLELGRPHRLRGRGARHAGPVPRLGADPYDTVSPNHDWGPVLFDARKVAKALKLRRGLLDLRATDGASGHVTTVTAAGPGARGGRERHRHPHAARSALDDVLARLALARPRRRPRPGTACDAADRDRARHGPRRAPGQEGRRLVGDGRAREARPRAGASRSRSARRRRRSTGSRSATRARGW